MVARSLLSIRNMIEEIAMSLARTALHRQTREKDPMPCQWACAMSLLIIAASALALIFCL
ncbi:MAG: hypothetical protein RLZZ444_152 [Pseudomonadota bacterium]